MEILPAYSSKVGGTGEGNDEFGLTEYLLYGSKSSLTCSKILQHGVDASEQGVRRILIALGRV
jgi:hypothetical protein